MPSATFNSYNKFEQEASPAHFDGSGSRQALNVQRLIPMGFFGCCMLMFWFLIVPLLGFNFVMACKEYADAKQRTCEVKTAASENYFGPWCLLTTCYTPEAVVTVDGGASRTKAYRYRSKWFSGWAPWSVFYNSGEDKSDTYVQKLLASPGRQVPCYEFGGGTVKLEKSNPHYVWAYIVEGAILIPLICCLCC